ncbi:sugar ABC transporter permease [Anaerocolumna cellulosilytica]|uniref:Sugar ABC transporter permease n=1 Tax=Anaerocolumna cellulosilytica TaxID=433286 RepID=A0A6S6R4F5_9FIRM|nr:carbohydrate ABC transporter permease [Anaerocolumna cellulosilytica]MBB5194676.1 putative aldouronate transport system permease protein [Anaerocolumna cellulosilytica]BCJ94362.1 sugar ABC transporter permease [Anaerocolumna cellulosilytica]
MKESRAYRTFRIINSLIMAFVVICTLYPFLYLIAQSFSSEAAVYAGKVTIFPIEFTTKTYEIILSKPDFFRYYGNTILYSIVGTVISVAGTAILAYPLSKEKLRLNKFFTPFVLFTMYFGGGLIPNYILVAKTLHMRDTIWAVVIPGAISAYYVILMKTFFASLPGELEEAATVDGLTAYGIFAKITLPLSKPILATMVLFNMVGIWNNWFGPSLYLQSKEKWPVALYLRQIIDSAISTTEMGASSDIATQIAATVKSSAMVLTALPIICIYPFVQKYFVQGMMIGSVKG